VDGDHCWVAVLISPAGFTRGCLPFFWLSDANDGLGAKFQKAELLSP
jgi:hypothetical protein